MVDVPNGSWFQGAISAESGEKGLLAAYTDGTRDATGQYVVRVYPDRAVTRYEAAMVIGTNVSDRGAIVPADTVAQASAVWSGFADGGDVVWRNNRDLAATAVTWGYIGVSGQANFDPDATLSRAQLAVVLARLLDPQQAAVTAPLGRQDRCRVENGQHLLCDEPAPQPEPELGPAVIPPPPGS